MLNTAPATISLATKVVTTLGGGTLLGMLANYYKDEIRSFFQSQTLNLVRRGVINESSIEEDLSFVTDFEKKFDAIKEHLPQDRQFALMSLMANYLRLLKQNTASNFLVSFRKATKMLLDLPYMLPEKISDDVRDDLKKQIEFDYPDNKEAINSYIDQLILFLNDRADKKPFTKPNPLLLMGPAGVGKTRLVEEVIAKNLNLPVFKTSLANLTRDELDGHEKVNLCNSYNEGLLLKALEKCSKENQGRGPVIVFLDDLCSAFSQNIEKSAHQEVLSWLMQILDPSQKQRTTHLFDRYGFEQQTIQGVRLSMDDFIFIAAANSSHFLYSEGLQRRLRNQITFNSISPKKKQDIALKHFKEKCELYKLEMSEAVEVDASNIAKTDPFPGVATMIDVIEKVVAAKRSKSSFSYKEHYQALQPESRKPAKAVTPMLERHSASSRSLDELAQMLEQLSLTNPQGYEQLMMTRKKSKNKA